MMSDRDMAARSAQILGLLREKYGVQARDLRRGLRRVGRQLPRGMRKRGRALLAAETQAQNPRLARQIDAQAVARDHDALVAYLRGIDVGDRRRGRILSLAAAVAFNLIAVAVLFIVWMWWRGYV
ncbi:hypothetical protein KDD17_10965 [Sulfitobacter albidus]|uniref:Uncharacterized protein n=1 Tax=Sulfitobacter albidus TaxID=2829501 RepID=A0A975JC18_9RHOB|nr:hypothetical protein [Sulfitobacter albidus]QUJ75490.1 hypothetical protein KDD17_10965 [Sulfitobacter albidus]